MIILYQIINFIIFIIFSKNNKIKLKKIFSLYNNLIKNNNIKKSKMKN